MRVLRRLAGVNDKWMRHAAAQRLEWVVNSKTFVKMNFCGSPRWKGSASKTR